MEDEKDIRARTYDRRELLKLGLVSIPVLWAGCERSAHDDVHQGHTTERAGHASDVHRDAGNVEARVIWEPESIPHDDALFPLGIHVGALHSDRGVIASFSEDLATKRLRVWRTMAPDDLRASAIVIDEDIAPNEGYIKALIEGLEGGKSYAAALFDRDGEVLTTRSTICAFTSPWPQGDLRPVTFAATACTKYVHMPYQALLRSAEEHYDAFLQLGDMGYFDEASTREEYRALWRETLRDPGYQAVMKKGAYYATRDDHEIGNNSVRSSMDPGHYDAGRDAWFEHLAVPRDGDRFWDSYRWGDSVELFVLDSRSERIPETRLSEDATYISDAQMSWFKSALKASPCHFKVVMTSVPFSNFPPLWGEGSDWWKGYAAQRQQLVDFIASEALDNIWFIAGDLHVGTVNRVDREGPMQRYWEILVGPGGPAFGNPIPDLVALQPEHSDDYLPPEQFLFADAYRKATFITFDPTNDTVHVRFIFADSGELAFETTLTQEPA